MAATSVRSIATLTENQMIEGLCQLTLNPLGSAETVRLVKDMSPDDREEFLKLADAHHVIIRALEPVFKEATQSGDMELGKWASDALNRERGRIENALVYLHAITAELEAGGCPTTVVKSLDHVPDMGNDLDLYTTAKPEQVLKVMHEKFNACEEARSWGDRIAQKWNFSIKGLPESVEIHVERLGQMGEHTRLAERFVTRRVTKSVSGRIFFVPAPEERIIVATLQRMYRHFYFRICDIANTAALIETGTVDLVELKRTTEAAGIWLGAATYLNIVSDYMKKYRGRGLNLPSLVRTAAVCGGDKILPRARFLRVPILPLGATLYSAQVTKTAMNGDVPGTFRLSMLPYLATAAAVAYKVTGSDKGVW